MNNQNIGMVYVATRRPHYVAEGFLSAHSARDFMADLPITLCTDLPDLPFARSPCFSAVLPLETRRRYRSLWAEGSSVLSLTGWDAHPRGARGSRRSGVSRPLAARTR